MSEMQGTLFEFDQNNELHRKAQHYIETMDREKFPSFGDLMVTAIVEYFDRYYGQEDTLPETDLDVWIETAVERALEKKLPEVLMPILDERFSAEDRKVSDEIEDPEDEANKPLDLEAVEKDINWGFLGG